MIILTGAAGFIGSCVLTRLNEAGEEDLILVDHMDDNPLKQKNLAGKKYRQYYDKAEFLSKIVNHELRGQIQCLIHMGACSSTLIPDPDYYRQNNFEYTRHLAQWTLDNDCRFIYASSAATYGDGQLGYSDADEVTRQLVPLNHYGRSKHDFDLWVLNQGLSDRFVGLKFFNVYGPNEYHKGDMRSVILKAYPRVQRDGKISLFKSYQKEYSDGEQKRDFIYIRDAVDVVVHFWQNPQLGGIFNVGTGKAQSWNQVAQALFKACGREPDIEYIDMPKPLRSQYQYYTQADISKLRHSGYPCSFTPLNDAVQDYVGYLKDERHY